jgi:hypothetical protein
MDKYIQRTANTNVILAHNKTSTQPSKKKQSTITSLSKVISLSDVRSCCEDLNHLRDLYDQGHSLQSSVVSLPGAARQQLQHEKRAQRIADRTELEMSSDDDSTDVSSPHSTASSTSSTSSTSPTSPTTEENRLEQRILTILQRLQAIHIALETLENTGIGKVVKRLTKPTKPHKRMFPDRVIGEAKRLIAKWRTTAEEGLSRRKRRKASGVDDVVVPHWKKGKLQFHGFNNKKQRRR